MEPKALEYRNWDELVFENRNKDYGAYAIRQSYNNKVLFGMGISVVILAILLTLPKLFPDVKVIPVLPTLHDGSVMITYIDIVKPKKPDPVRTEERQITRRTNTTPLVTTDVPVEELPTEQPASGTSTGVANAGGDINITGNA